MLKQLLKLSGALCFLFGKAWGADCVVSNTSDSVTTVGSLRWAVKTAEDGGCDAIVVASVLEGPIVLGSELNYLANQSFSFDGNGITITRAPSLSFDTLLSVGSVTGGVSIREVTFDLGDLNNTLPTPVIFDGTVYITEAAEAVDIAYASFKNGKHYGLVVNKVSNLTINFSQFNSNNTGGPDLFPEWRID